MRKDSIVTMEKALNLIIAAIKTFINLIYIFEFKTVYYYLQCNL